jgi:hypothetical protein
LEATGKTKFLPLHIHYIPNDVGYVQDTNRQEACLNINKRKQIKLHIIAEI